MAVGECSQSISDASLSVPSGLTAHASGSDIVSYTKKADNHRSVGKIFKVWAISRSDISDSQIFRPNMVPVQTRSNRFRTGSQNSRKLRTGN